MPYVSPHDRKTTQFYATIKRDVIIDFSGDEPKITWESESFKLTMPLTPVGQSESEEIIVIAKFGELLEAGICTQTGEVLPLDEMEDGVSILWKASQVPAELLAMSQEDLIREILKLRQTGTATVAVATEGEAAPSESGKKTTRRRVKPEITESTEQQEPVKDTADAVEVADDAPTEAESPALDPLAEAERIKATDSEEVVNVAF